MLLSFESTHPIGRCKNSNCSICEIWKICTKTKLIQAVAADDMTYVILTNMLI